MTSNLTRTVTAALCALLFGIALGVIAPPPVTQAVKVQSIKA